MSVGTHGARQLNASQPLNHQLIAPSTHCSYHDDLIVYKVGKEERTGLVTEIDGHAVKVDNQIVDVGTVLWVARRVIRVTDS